MATEVVSDWGLDSITVESVREDNESDVFSKKKVKKEKCNFQPEGKNIYEVTNMDDFVLSYFESMNSMARRIIAEEREVIKEHGKKWNSLTPDEQEKIIDDRLIKPEVRKLYGTENNYDSQPKWFPVLKLSHGITDPSDDRRTSIISVTDMHARDQFSAPWSWETESQQELNFVDQEELEDTLKDAVESDAKLGEIVVPPFGFPTKDFLGFESCESKELSLSSNSGGGSGHIVRKDYLDFDLDLKGTSISSSMQGSKLSLVSSQHSDTTSQQNNAEVEVLQSEQRTDVIDTPDLSISTNTAPSDEKLEQEEFEQRTESEKSSGVETNDSPASNDLMAFLTNW